MATINRDAAEVMARFPVNACTDVTGFGLIGHLLEMTIGSAVEAVIWADAVPILPEAQDWAMAGVVPGGTRDNLEHANRMVRWDDEILEVERLLLCDAQTSGGLLISLPEDEAQRLLAELRESGVVDSVWIGRMTAAGEGAIHVRRKRDA